MRIYTVFSQHKHYVLKKRRDGVIAFRRIEDTYCIREANLALFFIIALVFFMAALMVNIFSDYEFHKFFPLHNMGQCIPPNWTKEDTTGSVVRSNLHFQILNSTYYDALIVVIFFFLGFLTRNIPREFSVMNELMLISWL